MTQLGEGVSLPEMEQPEEKEEEKEKIRVRISMFFDGTQNNRINTEHRLSDDATYQKNQNKKKNNSYENDLSNVAIMEKFITDSDGYDNTLSCYIEGAGTMDDEKDKLIGYALGMGKSGVIAKVKKGIDEAFKKITGAVKSDFIIEELTLDVFGFSRGAAGARYFIYQALDFGETPLKQPLNDDGWEVKKVKVEFVGLYDTVSSHGIVYSNDRSDLKLDAIFHANKVIQLAAAEEHRKHFSLTTIHSACSNGREIYLPGVHSDIGGSYVDGANEDFIIYKSSSETKAREEMQRLIDSGWYKKDEITPEVTKRKRHNTTVKKVKLRVNRKNIANQYSRIPLEIMSDFAKESGISLSGEFASKCEIPGDLSQVKQKIEQYIANTKKSTPTDWQSNEPWQKKLRHDYLHYSAKYKIGVVPRIEGGERIRKRYHG